MAVQESGKAEALGLKNVGGVFVVLISGLGVAFLIAVVEYYFERHRRNKRLRYSIVSLISRFFPAPSFASKNIMKDSSDN